MTQKTISASNGAHTQNQFQTIYFNEINLDYKMDIAENFSIKTGLTIDESMSELERLNPSYILMITMVDADGNEESEIVNPFI